MLMIPPPGSLVSLVTSGNGKDTTMIISSLLVALVASIQTFLRIDQSSILADNPWYLEKRSWIVSKVK